MQRRTSLPPYGSRLVLLSLIACGCAVARAEDWPTYRHDTARSGISSETISLPLSECWRFMPRVAPDPAWEIPRGEPVEGVLELGRVRFDDAHHVIVAAGRVYFGTSGDGRVCALDAATGKNIWFRHAGGPVRLAPSFWDGRLYFGADDGFVRCVDAGSGATMWERRVGPRDERLLGHGKMISRWPVRTGVLIDGGTAYFGAGIFPGEGVYIEAANATDGRPIWRNDTCGEPPGSIVSPQGYLLASSAQLFAPLGRVSPASFDRATGKYQPAATFGKTIGGGSALIAGDQLYTGTEEIIAYQPGKKQKVAWLGGRQLIVKDNIFYVATDKAIVAFDRKEYSAPSVRRFVLRDQLRTFATDWRAAEKAEAKIAAELAADQKALAAMAPKSGERRALEEKIEEGGRKLEDARHQLEVLRGQREQMNLAYEQTDEAMSAAQLWIIDRKCADALIMAGNTLFAGGDGVVMAIDASSGKTVWETKVDGAARGLAAAGGRLFVSTTTGAIHCFGPKGEAASGIVADKAPPQRTKEDPKWVTTCQEAADFITRESGQKRGYALVLGCGTGRLAVELAKRTELMISAVDCDPSRVDAARSLIDAEGLLGSRISVDVATPGQLPFSDYFANLIVSERAVGGDGECIDAGEMARVLKPCGGTILLGGPSGSGGADVVRTLLPPDTFPGARVLGGGRWASFVRGALPGAGDWTHAYADAGNTAGGSDSALRAPLGLLWFGRPGPLEMISRHRRAAGPLLAKGVLLVQSENAVSGYDPYNGLRLWRRELPKVFRELVSHDCSNLASDGSTFFVVHNDECLRIDPRDGKTLATLHMPDGVESRWGYVASADGVLFGSATAKGRTCDRIFAVDPSTGRLLWQHEGPGIPHPSISVAGGRIFFVEERTMTSEERRAALHDQLDGMKPKDAERLMKSAALRSTVCLDAKTGRKLWEKDMDLTGGIGGLYWSSLGTMAARGTLVVFGVYTDGHYWKDFFAGQFESRRIIALDAADGHALWDKKIGYRVRPLIVGDTLHAEPWAYNLRTGQQVNRINPVTGFDEAWQYPRPGHHCGPPAAAQNVMLFRSGHIGYWDLEHDVGTMHFGGTRMGCWINFIMAGGLAMVPEASSGCMCPFPNMCTVVFSPSSRNRAWAQMSLVGGALPVKHLALNMGAPGDRKAKDGTLWLAYPRPTGSLVLPYPTDVSTHPGGAVFLKGTDFTAVDGTENPWLYASGYRGINRLRLPLLSAGDGSATYTVRLHFAELDGAAPGQRVFGIKLQGKEVARGFDPVAAAGAAGKAVIKEFNGIGVDGDLVIEFSPATRKPAPEQAPLLQAIELRRERVLAAGLAMPEIVLNRARPSAELELKAVNLKDQPFDGKLLLTAPDGFGVDPPSMPVHLDANNGKATLAIKASCLRPDMPAGKYVLSVRLVRADGGAEAEMDGAIEYLADRERVIIKACEDTYVTAGSPDSTKGATAQALIVDGGNVTAGDESHSIAFLKFMLDIPGTPTSATLVIANASNQSVGGGQIRRVEGRWSERGLTYGKRPSLGPVLGRMGTVASREVLRVPLEVNLGASRELGLAIDPVNNDGVDYVSIEGKRPAELHIEYVPHRGL